MRSKGRFPAAVVTENGNKRALLYLDIHIVYNVPNCIFVTERKIFGLYYRHFIFVFPLCAI